MIHTFVATIQRQAPNIKEYHYDFRTGEFTDGQGRSVTGEAISANFPRAARVGEKTARRAVFLQAIMDSTGEGIGQRSGILEQVLRWGESSSHPDNLNALFSTRNRPTEELRNRIAKTRQERIARLRAKGILSEGADSQAPVDDAPRLSRAPATGITAQSKNQHQYGELTPEQSSAISNVVGKPKTLVERAPAQPPVQPSSSAQTSNQQPTTPTPQNIKQRWTERADRAINRMDAAINGLGDVPDQRQYLARRYLTLGRIAYIDEIAKNN